MSEITVHIVKFSSRKYFYMYFDDPITGKRERYRDQVFPTLSDSACTSREPDQSFRVCTEGKLPKFWVDEPAQKRRRSEYFRMAPEFRELTDQVTSEARRGPVLPLPNHQGEQLSVKRVSRCISLIGRKALIRTGDNQHASAHGLKRSFGQRWSRRVRPLVLQELMRHTKLETTLKSYAGTDVDHTSAEVWAAKSAHVVAQLPESGMEIPQYSASGG